MTCLRQPESQAGNGVHSRMVSYSPTDGVGGRELTELRTHHGRGTPGMASDTFTVEEVGQLVRKWFPPPPKTSGDDRCRSGRFVPGGGCSPGVRHWRD